MKITKTTMHMSGGQRTLTVLLEADESMVVLKHNSHYRLGYPLDDQVMATHIIDSPIRVVWDSLEQQWLAAE